MKVRKLLRQCRAGRQTRDGGATWASAGAECDSFLPSRTSTFAADIHSQCLLTSAVEDHATSSGSIVLLNTLLLDGLLGDDITGAEEHGRRDDLGEQRPAGELGLVPVR